MLCMDRSCCREAAFLKCSPTMPAFLAAFIFSILNRDIKLFLSDAELIKKSVINRH